MKGVPGILFSILLVCSSFAGCVQSAEEVKDTIIEVGEEIVEAGKSLISKTLCFGSTVIDASVDGFVSGKVNLALESEYNQYLELDVPDRAAFVNDSSDMVKKLPVAALTKLSHPYAKVAVVTIKSIDKYGDRACAVITDDVDDDTWYNYTFALAEYASENKYAPENLLFSTTARLISSVTDARSETQPPMELELNFVAGMTPSCMAYCGFDDETLVFEEGLGLTSAFGVTRDAESALDGDVDTYAFSSAFLCPDLHSTPEECIESGASVLNIPGDYEQGNILDFNYQALFSCPSEDGESCSRESVSIDMYFCDGSNDCSSPVSITECSDCNGETEITKSATSILFVLKISDTHPDNAVSIKLFELSQRDG